MFRKAVRNVRRAVSVSVKTGASRHCFVLANEHRQAPGKGEKDKDNPGIFCPVGKGVIVLKKIEPFEHVVPVVVIGRILSGNAAQ